MIQRGEGATHTFPLNGTIGAVQESARYASGHTRYGRGPQAVIGVPTAAPPHLRRRPRPTCGEQQRTTRDTTCRCGCRSESGSTPYDTVVRPPQHTPAGVH